MVIPTILFFCGIPLFPVGALLFISKNRVWRLLPAMLFFVLFIPYCIYLGMHFAFLRDVGLAWGIATLWFILGVVAVIWGWTDKVSSRRSSRSPSHLNP